jgi:hypothetical protein
MRLIQMSDEPRTRLVGTDSSDQAPPVPAQELRHLLTAWFGLMAVGGAAFGLFAFERPFGPGVLAHPLVVFFAIVAAGLLTLRFLSTRPLAELISIWSLVAGIAIGLASFLFGNWFGVNLIAIP